METATVGEEVAAAPAEEKTEEMPTVEEEPTVEKSTELESTNTTK